MSQSPANNKPDGQLCHATIATLTLLTQSSTAAKTLSFESTSRLTEFFVSSSWTKSLISGAYYIGNCAHTQIYTIACHARMHARARAHTQTHMQAHAQPLHRESCSNRCKGLHWKEGTHAYTAPPHTSRISRSTPAPSKSSSVVRGLRTLSRALRQNLERETRLGFPFVRI